MSSVSSCFFSKFTACSAAESTYNALISACARKGDVDRAEFWLKKLLKSTAQADVASYSSVIHACAKANSLRRAEAARCPRAAPLRSVA